MMKLTFHGLALRSIDRRMGIYRGGGGGAVISFPEKNTQCPNAQVFKLREKTKGCTIILTSTETVIFKPHVLYVLYGQVY